MLIPDAACINTWLVMALEVMLRVVLVTVAVTEPVTVILEGVVVVRFMLIAPPDKVKLPPMVGLPVTIKAVPLDLV